MYTVSERDMLRSIAYILDEKGRTDLSAIIQSSSATTVMVVGFVNAGIMNLTQAMGVIMGANIGTTVTGWLVSAVEWAEFLSPSKIAPVAVIAGVIIMLTGKRRSAKEVSNIRKANAKVLTEKIRESLVDLNFSSVLPF